MNKPKKIATIKELKTPYSTYFDVDVLLGSYVENDNNALMLISNEDEPICTASLNPSIKLESNEVAIKDYSENEGILNELIRHSIISEVKRYIDGFPICEIQTI